MSRFIFIRPCWSCGRRTKTCRSWCECAKCRDPDGYEDWKENNPDAYENWLYEQRIYLTPKFVRSKEFQGNGKTLIFNSNKEKFNPDSMFGEVVEYQVKELTGEI